MSLWLWVVVVASGAAGGFLDALAGMGFGALSSTIMISGGVTPAIVIGTVNLAKVGSGLVSGVSHWRMGNVRRSWVLPLLIPAILGGIVAGFLVVSIPDEAIRVLMPCVLIIMGLLILRRFLFRSALLFPIGGGSGELALDTPQNPWQSAFEKLMNAPRYLLLGIIGFLGGILNGLSGAFGPFVTSSVLLRQRGHPRFTIGTVSFVEFFVAVAISATLLIKLPWGQIHWGLPLALMIGSIVTAPIGAYMSRYLPAKVMGIAVGVALISLNTWSLTRVLL